MDDITDTMDYLKKLITLREEINWEIEDERRELLDQLELLLRNWKGQLAELRPFFRPEEIDGLLTRLVFNEIYSTEVPLIDLVIRTGYKDSPKVDEDSEPYLLRTTPVHLAARRCSFKMQFIIPKLFQIYDRFDVSYIDQAGLTHFHVACQYGCEDIVGKFIELGRDVDCLEHRSGESAVDSPLHLALANGHKNVAEMLLRKGAKMNLTNKDGLSPLHIICNNEDNLGLAETFFKISTDIHQPIQINVRDSKGRTPLHLATKHENLDMIGLLLRNGADPNAADMEGIVPLHIICKRHDDDNLGERFFKISNDIQKTVQVDAMDKLGRTPLQWAVASLLPDLVNTLLIRSADVSSFVFPTEDYFGESYTLEWSLKMIVFSTMSIVKSLESKGYEVDQTAALTIMKILAKYGLIDESVNLDECLRTDQEFVRIAKWQMVKPRLSLYDFLQLPSEEAEKLFAMKDYKEFISEISQLCTDSHRAFTTHLCEIVTGRFFRDWALKLFSKKSSWLSKHYCEIFIGQQKIKGLWNICMEATNESTEWLNSMFTSDDESDLNFFVPSDDFDSKDMNQIDKANLKKFKGIRDKFNQTIEEERHELLDQLESLIRNWKGQLTDLRPFLQREEIDGLLIKFMKESYSIFSSIYIIELVIRTGYKDEPELDKDGVPLSLRTTPLHQAARRKCFYVVDRLFKIYNRYDVNYTDESGLTHFHVACRYGCNGVVRKFLELGQTPNCLARESVDPPLHLAVRNFDKETMELLLRSGADASLINKDGLTPLHIICKSFERYDDKLAKLFFEVNEKVNQTVQVHARDKLGRTPLQWAVANLMSDAVDTLLDHVDDLSDFVFPKDLAMKYTLGCTLQMIVFPTMSIVKSLRRKGYNLNQSDALMIMKVFANYGLIDDSVDVVECLRNDKKFAKMAKKQLVTSSMSLFDVNYTDESGLTHFHVACQHHCNDVVKKFLELGLNPNCPEQTSDTSTVDSPLHLSLTWANEVAVELLLRNGADPNMTNSEGSTPSHVIGHGQLNDEVAELFFKINDELRQTVHVNGRDKRGQTPLHSAARSGNKEGTELLLRRGANPNWADTNGSTPLHVICETDEVDCDSLEHVQKVFEICDEQRQPVRVDAQDRLGRTPLHVALARDKQKVAELLLARGADRNLATKDGSTPLHIICMRDRDDYNLVKMFFEIADDDQQLVNVDARDKLGRTPLQWAVANLLSDVVDVIMDYMADLSNFTFPTEDYFAEKYTLDCISLQKVVFRTMYILEWLDGKGYNLDQTAALTVMKTFAKHGLIDEPVDINECLRNDEEFAKIAKNQMVSPSLSLYDFLQLPHKEAEKIFLLEDYEEFTREISHLCDESHKTYIRYLCETVTRGFFRQAALKFFSEKNSWLPESCFENVIGQLTITILWKVCMEASNEDTQWLASICDELRQPVEVNARNSIGQTALHLAVYGGYEKLTRFLLNKGADPNLASTDGSTPLHIICKRDDSDKFVKVLIETKKHHLVQFDARDVVGRTPLQWAVANLLSDTVDVLLHHGANVSGFVFPKDLAVKYSLDCTLQMIVFRTMSIVKSLSKKGYDLDQNAALTIMKTFAKHGLIDDTVDIDELLRNDVEFALRARNQLVSPSLSVYDFLQLPPVKAEKLFTVEQYEYFTSEILSRSSDESHRAYIRYLCETVTRGFFRDWALKMISKKSPWIPKQYREMFIGQLKIKGLWDICMAAADENTQCYRRYKQVFVASPHHCGALRGRTQTPRHRDRSVSNIRQVRRELHQRVRIDAFSRGLRGRLRRRRREISRGRPESELRLAETGDSPLHLALAGSHRRVVRSLVTRGADPNLANKDGSTPLHVICKSHRDDGSLEMFFEINGDRNQTVRVDAQDEQGQTPLHLALLRGNKNTVESLLRKGADPNLATAAGLTALHIHCNRVDDDEFAETILETSRDMDRTLRVDARDASGNTPLQTAVARGHEKMIGFLLRNGADPNLADAEGSTPLHNICRRDDVDDMMEIFFRINEELDKPVRVDARDNLGRTPLQWAVANLKTNLFESLLNHDADLSSFVFPTENYFAERYTLDCEIQLVALPAMYIVKTLERKGYALDVAAVVTVMKTFVGHGLVGRPPTDLDERWYNDVMFARIAKKHKVSAHLSLYDFVRLTPDKAEKLFIAIEDYEEFAYGFRLLPMGPYKACIEHVCRTVSRGFFRRWAMEFFMTMTRHRLPILCCDMIVEQLANEDLLRIGLAIAGQS
ncbi:unnamed protein product [Trichogramma brassicae]|uniref:Uncharacterized protein n=1 Tax=Trichogramma brassicae TaxID=86971 RepID=A0A6H5HVX6_9HYME|nr:unnamed protein product [Trichogramma brassicae]